jgi:hypothetical protein
VVTIVNQPAIVAERKAQKQVRQYENANQALRRGARQPEAEVSEWSEWMRRELASTYLRVMHGITAAPQTLARWAVEGVGPLFSREGRFPIYSRDGLDEFARKRRSPEAVSNAEHRSIKAEADRAVKERSTKVAKAKENGAPQKQGRRK